MNFNYRDFFIHNDDLHIIKEQLSIVDEKTSRQDALTSNAKAVWDAWASKQDEQSIARALNINVETVEKIIYICLMHTDENKSVVEITKALGINKKMVYNVLKNAIGLSFKRQQDKHFVNDAKKIYDYHKIGKTPEEIVNLVNKEKKEYYEKIDLNKVNTVLKIVDMAQKQMVEKGEINIQKIIREIVYKISDATIIDLIKKLNLGKLRYTHVYTVEQDAFILFNYLQGIGPLASAGKFNEKFSNKSNQLDIINSSIRNHLKMILNPKGKGESDISDYIVKLLTMYKDTYFQSVNIENPDTKDLLTHYRPPETVRGRDPLARKGGKVDPTRQMSGQTGNLEPDIHQTINTGESPASGQLGKKSGAPINPQGALSL